MVTRKIPQIDQDKTWSCNINNVIYEYPSGTEQEVPEAVASLIDFINASQPTPKQTDPTKWKAYKQGGWADDNAGGGGGGECGCEIIRASMELGYTDDDPPVLQTVGFKFRDSEGALLTAAQLFEAVKKGARIATNAGTFDFQAYENASDPSQSYAMGHIMAFNASQVDSDTDSPKLYVVPSFHWFPSSGTQIDVITGDDSVYIVDLTKVLANNYSLANGNTIYLSATASGDLYTTDISWGDMYALWEKGYNIHVKAYVDDGGGTLTLHDILITSMYTAEEGGSTTYGAQCKDLTTGFQGAFYDGTSTDDIVILDFTG